MNEKKFNPQLVKTILLSLLIVLPFVLYMSMGIPVLSYVVYGMLLAVFGVIVVVN